MIKIFFILNRKVTPQKNRCVGCWLLALPRAQMTRLSRILGIWFTYYVPVLINFMTPSKHLSIAYQGINLRRLLRFFFLSKAHHAGKCDDHFFIFISFPQLWSFPPPRGGEGVNVCLACAAGLSESIPHYSLFCGQL